MSKKERKKNYNTQKQAYYTAKCKLYKYRLYILGSKIQNSYKTIYFDQYIF